MSLQFVISIIFFLLTTGVGVWFYKKKHTLEYLHLEAVQKLEIAINQNQNQINFRNLNLNLYDFQKYNLSEALVMQPEIHI